MYAAVSRYSKPPFNVHYWELGNEPDKDPDLVEHQDDEFGCWGDWDDEYYGGRYYAEMLKVVYPAIKAADPQAQVVLGGLLLGCDPRVPDACGTFPNADRPSHFLEGVLLNGGGDSFDIMSYHSYAYWTPPTWDSPKLGYMGTPRWPGSETVVPEKADFIRQMLAQYGHPDKPLMNTEAALLCYDNEFLPGCRQQQSVWVPRAYADAIATDHEVLVYYAITNDHWLNTGLVASDDLSPYPAYHAYVVASHYLSSAEYVGPAQGYGSGIEGHEFATPEGRMDLIWSADGSLIPASLPSGIMAHDRFGKLIGTGSTIGVDYGPVWVIGP
jgi:hypothetical protein